MLAIGRKRACKLHERNVLIVGSVIVMYWQMGYEFELLFLASLRRQRKSFLCAEIQAIIAISCFVRSDHDRREDQSLKGELSTSKTAQAFVRKLQVSKPGGVENDFGAKKHILCHPDAVSNKEATHTIQGTVTYAILDKHHAIQLCFHQGTEICLLVKLFQGSFDLIDLDLEAWVAESLS